MSAEVSPEPTEAESREAKGKPTILDGFRDYLRNEHAVKLVDVTPRDIPLVALGAHSFLHGVVDSRYRKLTEAGSTPDFYPTPPGAIRGRIKQYFQEYGVKRWTGQSRLTKEAAFIRDNTNEVETVMSDNPHIRQANPRFDKFPEVRMAVELHRLLKITGHKLAADAVEIVEAAHGQRFREIGGTMLKDRFRDSSGFDYEEEYGHYSPDE